MKITKIKKQKNHRKYNIFVDGKYIFSISSNTLTKFDLSEGQEFDSKDFSELVKNIALFECESALINFLQYRMRSEMEIISKLKTKGCKPEIISELINKYKNLGYVNDTVFVESYLLDLISHHPQSKYSIINKLITKGINQELINEVIDKHLTYEKEKEIAERSLNSQRYRFEKLSPAERKNKALAFLQRKGFSSKIAFEVIRDFPPPSGSGP
ncbi:MAG: RecX family transcriptional regulator [Candidatus Cloacimonetes bacterium]|nr:RecX family transcriptional regulator [Candidatus Cloacimonadota bacterium]